MSKDKLWLLEIDALDINNNPETLRFSSGEYIPTENFYNPRLKQPGLYQEGLFSGDILPASRSSFGVSQLINNDSELEYLADYAIDGREVRAYYYDGNDAKLAFVGSAERFQFTRRYVEVRLRAMSEPLSVKRDFNIYLGDNILPDGLEGVEDDIKGNPKPRLYGEVENFQPVFVNSAKLIYQVSDLEDCIVEKVYDNGVELSYDGEYSSLGDLQTESNPTAGTWKRYQGYVRLGSSPVGQITVDASTSDNSLGSVFQKIANEAGYVVSEGKNELDSFGNCRMIATSEERYINMLDDLVKSAGCYWRVVQDGTIEVGAIPLPNNPTLHIEDYMILDISRTSLGGGRNGIPVYRVEVQHDRIETVQNDLAGDVGESRVARVSSQYRKASSKDSAVKERHRLSESWDVESRLSSPISSQTLADNVLSLLSVRRDSVQATIILTDESVDIPILSSVRVTTPRLGYSSGRDMIVVQKTYDPVKNKLSLVLWG